MKKITIVEDDPAIREILEILLESENFAVTSFGNATDFLNYGLNSIPEVYLFDVMLPDGSGVDLCNYINKQLGLSTPVVMMSAHATIKDITSACHPADLISKPFDLDVLTYKLKSAMNR